MSSLNGNVSRYVIRREHWKAYTPQYNSLNKVYKPLYESILSLKTGRISRKLVSVQFWITLRVLKVYVLEEKSIDGLMQTRYMEKVHLWSRESFKYWC